MQYQLQGKFTPPNACNVILPFRHPISLSLRRCQLTGVRWVTQMGQRLQILQGPFRGRLLTSRPARHSVTPRCQLASLSFLRLNLRAYGLRGYGLSHSKIEMSKGGWSSLGGAQFGTKYRDCMGKTDRPSCAMNFQHFIIVSYCENGGVQMLHRN